MIMFKRVIHGLSMLLDLIVHFTSQRVRLQRAMIYIPIESTRAYVRIRRKRR